jgi:hypothetical protein
VQTETLGRERVGASAASAKSRRSVAEGQYAFADAAFRPAGVGSPPAEVGRQGERQPLTMLTIAMMPTMTMTERSVEGFSRCP